MHRVTTIIFSLVVILGLALSVGTTAMASVDEVAGYAKDGGAAMTAERVGQFRLIQDGSNEHSPADILSGNAGGVVILDMDDVQAWWLRDTAIAVVQVNIDENVDLFLNVIPWQIGLDSTLATKLQEWNTSRQGLIEMGQHGYMHDDNLSQLSYADQRTIVEEGVAELNAIGINPRTFTPGNGDQNTHTLSVLADLGFHTDLDCWMGLDSTPEILVLRQCACELSDKYGESGPGVNFKSSSTLMADIDSTINSYGYALVAFHMQDFSTTKGALDTGKLDQYRQILRDLKNSGKYQFVTPEEYYQMQHGTPSPTISSVSPSQGAQGKTLSVTISGSNFSGASAVSFGSDITVNSFNVNSDSQITANSSIDSDAALGPRDVSVTTLQGSGTLTGGFTVVTQGLPTISSVSPSQGAQGKTITVTISGSNFNGASAVSFGSGITINSFTVINDGQITCNISIASDAALGPRDVSVTTLQGVGTLTGGFTITQGPPAVSSVSPSQGAQGKTLTVTINGSNFGGATVVSFGLGITVNSFVVNNYSQITSNVTIASDAALGPRNVSVTTPGGIGTLTSGFTVTQGPPTISSVSPSQGAQGKTLIVTINGSSLIGTTSVSFGSGIAVNSFVVSRPTSITANITIGISAAPGPRDVSVTTAVGTGTLTGGFIVTQALPTIYSVVPSQGSRGQTLTVIINGRNFTGATSVSFGSKITVNNFTINSDTQITAYITIATKANRGARNVSVTTLGGTGTLPRCFTVI